MNIDLAALPDDVETLQRLVRAFAAERTSLREANAEIERLNLIIKKLQRSSASSSLATEAKLPLSITTME